LNSSEILSGDCASRPFMEWENHFAASALVDRLEKERDGFCQFILDSRAPFDNSAAERDIRVSKLKAKVSGGMRTDQGG